MNTGWWDYVILFGIPGCFALGFLLSGVRAFQQEQEPYNPDKYRS